MCAVAVAHAADPAGQGAQSPKITLEDAIRAALQRNPELLAARQRIEAATGHAIQSRLWQNPELELSAEDIPTGSGLSQSTELIGVSQTVPFPGKKSLDAKIGRAEVAAAQ